MSAVLPHPLAALLALVKLGTPIALGGATVVPLLGDGDGPDADLLEEGIESGVTQVSEVSESGVVGRVRVAHRGARMLLLVDGEQVVGAKQNRVLNASFLVAPGQPVDVPVSCVERGRWNYETSDFTASGTTLNVTSRSRKLRRVSEALRDQRGYDADQGAVWSDVDEYLRCVGVESDTAAFADGASARAASRSDRLALLEPQPRQIGLAVVHGRTVLTLDLFGSPKLYARAWKKVARGLVVEDLPPKKSGKSDPTKVVMALLARIQSSSASTAEPPGCGTTHHGESGKVAFNAIVHEGQVFHAAVAGG